MTAAMSGSSGDDGDTGDWPPNLLARIATTIGRRHQENVASAALLYVIQADSHARCAVVADIAHRAGLAAGADLPEELSFAGQDHGEDGRPDLVGHDDCGARVVIEAKIDAGFQPGKSPGTAPGRSDHRRTGADPARAGGKPGPGTARLTCPRADPGTDGRHRRRARRTGHTARLNVPGSCPIYD